MDEWGLSLLRTLSLFGCPCRLVLRHYGYWGQQGSIHKARNHNGSACLNKTNGKACGPKQILWEQSLHQGHCSGKNFELQLRDWLKPGQMPTSVQIPYKKRAAIERLRVMKLRPQIIIKIPAPTAWIRKPAAPIA